MAQMLVIKCEKDLELSVIKTWNGKLENRINGNDNVLMYIVHYI